MEGRILLLVAMTTVPLIATLAVPLQSQTNREVPKLVGSGYAEPGVVVFGDSDGSGVTPDLREGAVDGLPLNPDGCLDENGLLRAPGTSWNLGCAQTCDCVTTPEGPIRHCGPVRCAIPMISPGCQIVPNPNRNDTSGENCCDVVECTPVYCRDSQGGKHEVYTSWLDGELDCYCGYNFQNEKPEPACSLIAGEVPTTSEATPNAIQPLEELGYISDSLLRETNETLIVNPPKELGYRSESLVNETNETFDVHHPEEFGYGAESAMNGTIEAFDVCVDENGVHHGVGKTWHIGCHTECRCERKGEITAQHCTPFPCPVPSMLPGCWIAPNPQRDTVNSLHCCNVVKCPPKLCLGQDQLLYELNSVWYENAQACTCVLNYNVNQALKKCGTIEEIKNV